MFNFLYLQQTCLSFLDNTGRPASRPPAADSSSLDRSSEAESPYAWIRKRDNCQQLS